MMPNVQLALNQQFQQGCLYAQQGVYAEQLGNWPAAAQCYDQSIAMIGQTMAVAAQYGMPILDNVYASLAVSHFQAARAKAASGWAQFAPAHLAAAAQAINQAVAMRPDVPQYQAAASIVQAAQAGLSGAQPVPSSVQFLPAAQGAQSNNHATQEQWVKLITSGFDAFNNVASMFQQGGQNGSDGSQWNQGGGWSW